MRRAGTPKKPNVNIDKPSNLDKLLWFEFYPDMTFSRGRGETVDEDRKNFGIDSEEKTLQIYTSRGVRSGKYKITADMLQITWEPKERTIQLERVEKRF